MVASNSSLVFKVKRGDPDLVRPSEPTPSEVKSLSYDDNRLVNRRQISCILFYPATTDMKDKDPAKVIKTALAKALVYYYPWAGRLREVPDGGLVVDCTAEGVGFLEADADVRLEEFGEDSLHPPFPCIEELVYYKACSFAETIGCPIFALQVTRMLCGGFILSFTFSHAMCDGKGVCQFLNAITELARGAAAPSLQPIWQRELRLKEPRVTCPTVATKFSNFFQGTPMTIPSDNESLMKTPTPTLTHRSVFFGPLELDALRSRVPDDKLRGACSTFDLVTASVFRCRTIALEPRPEEEARLLFIVDARRHLLLPDGYYGNACVPATFVFPAGDVCRVGSFGFVVEEVKKAKEEVTEEYVRSLSALEGQPPVPTRLDLLLSDWTRVGFSSLDFGWGKPVYAGNTDTSQHPQFISIIVPFRNGRLVSLALPADAMDRFSTALHNLIHGE